MFFIFKLIDISFIVSYESDYWNEFNSLRHRDIRYRWNIKIKEFSVAFIESRCKTMESEIYETFEIFAELFQRKAWHCDNDNEKLLTISIDVTLSEKKKII